MITKIMALNTGGIIKHPMFASGKNNPCRFFFGPYENGNEYSLPPDEYIKRRKTDSLKMSFAVVGGAVLFLLGYCMLITPKKL